MNNIAGEKTCYCCTCRKSFHYLGIARHRAMHHKKLEDCKITYSDGKTYIHEFSKCREKVNGSIIEYMRDGKVWLASHYPMED